MWIRSGKQTPVARGYRAWVEQQSWEPVALMPGDFAIPPHEAKPMGEVDRTTKGVRDGGGMKSRFRSDCRATLPEVSDSLAPSISGITIGFVDGQMDRSGKQTPVARGYRA